MEEHPGNSSLLIAAKFQDCACSNCNVRGREFGAFVSMSDEQCVLSFSLHKPHFLTTNMQGRLRKRFCYLHLPGTFSTDVGSTVDHW